MARQLAVVEIEGKKYFDDTRLREYHNVSNFMDSIQYGDFGTGTVKIIQQRTDMLEKLCIRQRAKGKRW